MDGKRGRGRGSAPTGGGSRGTAVPDLLLLADGRLAQDKYDEAARYYQDVIRLDPKNEAALSGLGNAFIGLDRYDEAHACFRTILESDPDHPAAHAGMGDLCMRLSEFGRAVEAYDRSIAAGSTSKGVHMGRGEALKNLGKFEAGAGALAKALKCDADDTLTLFMLGECFFAIGRPRDALHYFGRVYSLSPDMAAVAMHNMAGCLAVLGRHEEAIASYEKALDHDECDWDSALGIASSLAAAGRNEAAMAEFDHLVDEGPEEIAVQALLYKARMLDAAGRSDDAIEACDKVVEIDGLNSDALLRKARILARSGRRLAALSCISAARYGDPYHKAAARDAVVVTRALEREGGLPWMWKRAGEKGRRGRRAAASAARLRHGNRRDQNGRNDGGLSAAGREGTGAPQMRAHADMGGDGDDGDGTSA